MLWQLKRTSPFHYYSSQRLPAEPLGLPIVEYLEIWVDGATPDEWIALGADFLGELGERTSS